MKHIDQATFREEVDCLTARLRPTVTDAVSDPPAHWAAGRGYVDVDMLRRDRTSARRVVAVCPS